MDYLVEFTHGPTDSQLHFNGPNHRVSFYQMGGCHRSPDRLEGTPGLKNDLGGTAPALALRFEDFAEQVAKDGKNSQRHRKPHSDNKKKFHGLAVPIKEYVGPYGAQEKHPPDVRRIGNICRGRYSEQMSRARERLTIIPY